MDQRKDQRGVICWPQADIDPGKIRGENKDNAAGIQPRKSCDPLRESICLKHVSHRNEDGVNTQGSIAAVRAHPMSWKVCCHGRGWGVMQAGSSEARGLSAGNLGAQ